MEKKNKIFKLKVAENAPETVILKEPLIITVPEKLAEAYKQAIYDGAIPEVYFKGFTKGRVPNHKELLLDWEAENPTAQDYFKIGADIERLKFTVAAEVGSERVAELSKKENTIDIQFSKEFAIEMYERFKEPLKITKRVASNNGMTLHFNVSDCRNRSELVTRLAIIYDAIYEIKSGKRKRLEFKSLLQIEEHLKNHCSYMEKVQENLVEVSGEYLISSGIANAMDLDNRAATMQAKISNWLKGVNRDVQNFYHGEVVIPAKSYVILLPSPKLIESPQPINFRKEIDLHYRYGETLYFGGGMDMVNEFQKTIIDAHNKMVEDNKTLN